ncbi:MAG: MFS transporter [Eubacteriaceae bacterium]|nr:MFS transporter [Eubacteriaceae bacterium]
MTDTQIRNKALSYRWGIYFIVLLLFFSGVFLRFSPAAIKTQLQDAFLLNAVGFSNLNAMYFYTYMIMQIPVGIMADTVGPKKMIFTGSIVMGIGCVIFGLAKTESALLISRLLLGLGSSVFYISILKWQTRWFTESEYGFITGFTTFCGNMGGAFAQGPLVALVGLISWQLSFLYTGAVVFALSAGIFFLFENSPKDKGFNVISEQIDKKSNVNIFTAFMNVLKNKNIWPLFLYSFLCSGVSFTTGIWGVTFLSQIYNVSKISAGQIMFWQTAAFCLGCVFIGKISDMIKSRKIPAIVCASTCLLIWCILYFDGMKNIPFYTASILIIIAGGFNCGAVMCITSAKEICNPLFSGVSTSFINTAPFIGGSIFPIIFGFIIDKYTPLFSGAPLYHKAFLMFVACLTIALIMSLLFIETKAKSIYIKNI